jgi:hypothetical protein
MGVLDRHRERVFGEEKRGRGESGEVHSLGD